MIGRFVVATSSGGLTRRVEFDVFLYDDADELARAAAAYTGQDVAGWVGTRGAVHMFGFHYPDPGPPRRLGVIRLLVPAATLEVIAHEATHAAANVYFATHIVGVWDARARSHLNGANEPLAYAGGELVDGIVRGLRRLGMWDARRMSGAVR